MFVGVLQHPVPEGVMLSQFPPLPEAAIGVKRITAPLLAIEITWFAGFEPRFVLKVTVRKLHEDRIAHRDTDRNGYVAGFRLHQLLAVVGAPIGIIRKGTREA